MNFPIPFKHKHNNTRLSWGWKWQATLQIAYCSISCLICVHGDICEQLMYENIVLVIYIVYINNVKCHWTKWFRRYLYMKSDSYRQLALLLPRLSSTSRRVMDICLLGIYVGYIVARSHTYYVPAKVFNRAHNIILTFCVFCVVLIISTSLYDGSIRTAAQCTRRRVWILNCAYVLHMRLTGLLLSCRFV